MRECADAEGLQLPCKRLTARAVGLTLQTPDVKQLRVGGCSGHQPLQCLPPVWLDLSTAGIGS